MNIVIDIGNTRSKYAFFREDQLLEAHYQLDALFEKIEKWRKQGEKLSVLLAGSGQIDFEMRRMLERLADCFLIANPTMPLPLKIGYATPETLGFDRIAICVGGRCLHPGIPLLIIDSGTCVTYNYLNAAGVFLGGNISPGLEIRFKSLHQYTARLPYVCPTENYGGIGRSTEEAIRNGVMEGMFFEVKCSIERFMTENPDGRVLLTGGNAYFLENRLPFPVSFYRYLSFIGLNEILKYVKK